MDLDDFESEQSKTADRRKIKASDVAPVFGKFEKESFGLKGRKCSLTSFRYANEELNFTHVLQTFVFDLLKHTF